MRSCSVAVAAVGLVLAGSAQQASLAEGAESGATVVYLEGRDVRCVAEDRDGTLWVGTSEGAFRLPPGARHPEAREPEPLADRVINDIVVDESGVVWFCTDHGVIRRAGDDVTEINHLQIPVRGTQVSDREGEPLRDLGRVLCGAAVGESVWFGTAGAIVQHFPLGGTWLARTKYLEWGGIAGAILMGPAPIRDCRQILADADGRLWALTHGALLTANREGKGEPIKDWSWHTGIMSYGDGDDWVGMHFWQLMTRPIRLGEGDKYGAPAAIATDASGAIRILVPDGHILRLPDFPDVTAGRVWKTWMEFAVVAPARPRLLALGRPYALGYMGDRVVVARARDNAKPILLVGTVPGEDWTVKATGTRPTEIHDLLLASDGRALVATCSGLVVTRLQ